MGTNQHPGSTPEINGTYCRPTRALRRAAAAAVRRLAAGWRGTPDAPVARATVRAEGLEARQMLSRTPAGPSLVDVLDPADKTTVVATVLTVTGTKKADTIVLTRVGTTVVVNFNGVPASFEDGTYDSIKVLGGKGNDTIRVDDGSDAPVGPVFIDGGSGNDVIRGGVSDDVILGGSGNDTIDAGDGLNNVDGGSGNDKITGGNHRDVLKGGKGNDLLIGGKGNDDLDGGAGNDRLLGGDGDDNLIGGSGKNTFGGGAGTNTDDAGASRKNIVSPVADTPNHTAEATPLAFFGTRTGLTPGQIRGQYGFGNLADPTFANRGEGQAVAVVIPYDVKNIRASVNAYSTAFSLPQIDTNSLQIINATGVTPATDPDPFTGWEAEAALNLEQIHSIAPAAQLYLILADSDLFTDLFVAVDKAVDILVSRHGGGVVSMTFGSQNGELSPGLQQYLDQSFTRRASRSVTFVTGSGDVGGTVSYPATSPYVTSVGGTSLERDTLGNLTGRETGWANSGGGLSTVYTTAPGYQAGVTVAGTQVARRATPDLAFNADPNSGVALYVATGFGDVDGDGTSDSGWLPGGAGGTSAAAPAVAGMIALANEVRLESGRDYLGVNFNDAIYDLNVVYPGFYFNDIVGGTAGANTAVAGYDLVTGNGSPRASLLIDRLASAATRPLAFNDVEWFGEFREAINKVGVIATPGAGFINGDGSISGNNELTMNLNPRLDRTPLAPSTDASGANALLPTSIFVDNFTPVTLLRLDNNTVTGVARANVTIGLLPLALPSPTTPDDSAGTGGGTPTTPPTTPGPTPVPGFFVAGLDESVPPNVNGELRTWQIDLRFSGQVYRDKHGREHIKGEFINRFTLYPDMNNGEPVEGLEPIFRGKFEA